jgi:hypothetical protein
VWGGGEGCTQGRWAGGIILTRREEIGVVLKQREEWLDEVERVR